MTKASGYLILVLSVASLALYADDWTDVAQSHGAPIMGRIIQVVGTSGFYLVDLYRADVNAWAEGGAGGYAPSGTTALLAVGDHGSHVDGDLIGSHWTSLNGIYQPIDIWYYAGTYSYTTVTGATATVRVYCPDQAWAAKRLASQAAGN